MRSTRMETSPIDDISVSALSFSLSRGSISFFRQQLLRGKDKALPLSVLLLLLLPWELRSTLMPFIQFLPPPPSPPPPPPFHISSPSPTTDEATANATKTSLLIPFPPPSSATNLFNQRTFSGVCRRRWRWRSMLLLHYGQDAGLFRDSFSPLGGPNLAAPLLRQQSLALCPVKASACLSLSLSRWHRRS